MANEEWTKRFLRLACYSPKDTREPRGPDEIRALRELPRQFQDSKHIFGAPASTSWFTSTWLRHGCGYALANAGHDTRPIQDWLGHRSIQHRAFASRQPLCSLIRGTGELNRQEPLRAIDGLLEISRRSVFWNEWTGPGHPLSPTASSAGCGR